MRQCTLLPKGGAWWKSPSVIGLMVLITFIFPIAQKLRGDWYQRICWNLGALLTSCRSLAQNQKLLWLGSWFFWSFVVPPFSKGSGMARKKYWFLPLSFSHPFNIWWKPEAIAVDWRWNDDDYVRLRITPGLKSHSNFKLFYLNASSMWVTWNKVLMGESIAIITIVKKWVKHSSKRHQVLLGNSIAANFSPRNQFL